MNVDHKYEARKSRMKPCLDLTDYLPHLKERYPRFALVSLSRHVDQLDPRDTDTLIISCNWLLWQKEAAKGRHCLHYESLSDGSDPLHLGTDHYLRACDWLFSSGKDVTLFRDVSLGRKLISPIGQVIMEWNRLAHALEALIRRYQPGKILFFDFQAELNRLDPSARFSVVVEVATEFGVNVIDRRDPPGSANPELPNKEQLVSPVTPRMDEGWRSHVKTGMLRLFETVANGLSRARRALNSECPAVLILATHRTTLPLLEKFRGGKLFPMLPARLFPHKTNIRFLLGCWARGVLLIAAPRPGLTAAERGVVDTIAERLERSWKSPAKGHEKAVRDFIRTQVLESGWFHWMAGQVKWAEHLFDTHRPEAVFADGMLNTDINIFLELARARGVPTALTWHSPVFQKSKIPIFGNDPRVRSVVERCFTWGKAHEDWLDDTAARCTKVRTGKPTDGGCANPVGNRRNGRNALILQFAVPGEDIAAKSANEYNCFVELVRLLRDVGYTEIRLKLHPSCAVTAYYGHIAEYFHLDCTISRDGPFEDHAAWADIVIGPICTAAMLDVMAAGKYYYPFHLSPSSQDTCYLKGCRIYKDLESLRQALQEGSPPHQRETLNHITSAEEFPDSAERVWAAMRAMVDGRRSPTPR